jgi:CubicO group peptidase (beta-lactamase class C family)
MHGAVLAPLGMTRSTFAQTLPPAWRDAAATAHRGDGSAVPGRWHVHPEAAAAGLWTTPTDLARLVVEVQQAQAGRSDKLLSRATASVMLTRVLGEYGLASSSNSWARTAASAIAAAPRAFGPGCMATRGPARAPW